MKSLLLALSVLVSTAAPGQDLSAGRVRDARIIAAMQRVQRSDYLPPAQQPFALEDRPLPIGHGQTTSQPSLIAMMVDELRLKRGCSVLEVGTGSGYQTALLAELCDHVYSIDIVEPLVVEAKRRLTAKGYRNAQLKAGDGYQGWPQHAPFDAIVVCASVEKVPAPLLEQLEKGGRMVVPVGTPQDSRLVVYEKDQQGKLTEARGIPVRFVPFTGENADKDRRPLR